jgi:hypothetical protein
MPSAYFIYFYIYSSLGLKERLLPGARDEIAVIGADEARILDVRKTTLHMYIFKTALAGKNIRYIWKNIRENTRDNMRNDRTEIRAIIHKVH